MFLCVNVKLELGPDTVGVCIQYSEKFNAIQILSRSVCMRVWEGDSYQSVASNCWNRLKLRFATFFEVEIEFDSDSLKRLDSRHVAGPSRSVSFF